MQRPAREAAILNAASQLLMEVAFDDLTMAVIASKAGMSKRTVYEHFKSREDLLVQSIIETSRSVFLPLRDEDTQRPLHERLSLLLRINTPPGFEKNKLEFLRSMVAKARALPDLAQKLYDNGYGALKGYVQDELTHAVACGEIYLQEGDMELAADMLLDMAFDNKLTRLLLPNAPPQEPDEVMRRREYAIGVFLRGCAHE